MPFTRKSNADNFFVNGIFMGKCFKCIFFFLDVPIPKSSFSELKDYEPKRCLPLVMLRFRFLKTF